MTPTWLGGDHLELEIECRSASKARFERNGDPRARGQRIEAHRLIEFRRGPRRHFEYVADLFGPGDAPV
jgi:hypothetical protein